MGGAYRGAWIDGEEEAFILDLLVQTHPRDGGLDNDVHAMFSPVNVLFTNIPQKFTNEASTYSSG